MALANRHRTWAQRSFELVEQGGYLDRLSEVYNEPAIEARPLRPEQREQIVKAHREEDVYSLFISLLRLKRFPFNDPFIGVLRENAGQLKTNPRTIERLKAKLRSMQLDEMLKKIEAPPEFNRQMGPLFNQWLQATFHFVESKEHLRSAQNDIVFYKRGGKKLKELANSLDLATDKQPDFIAKVRGRYIV
ncbi:hypothetical protein IIA79_05090 [bacterium]|nr:hypothetical protein [bacterium]